MLAWSRVGVGSRADNGNLLLRVQRGPVARISICSWTDNRNGFHNAPKFRRGLDVGSRTDDRNVLTGVHNGPVTVIRIGVGLRPDNRNLFNYGPDNRRVFGVGCRTDDRNWIGVFLVMTPGPPHAGNQRPVASLSYFVELLELYKSYILWPFKNQK